MGPASDRPGWLRAEAATWEGAVGTTVERGWEKKSPTTTDEAGNVFSTGDPSGSDSGNASAALFSRLSELRVDTQH
ncbi:hypothetical protein DTO207G8_9175 [Paecilomyces variotii]|nr:hypothetical protein DTO207G8_9175 [Paecilomyces variotii]